MRRSAKFALGVLGLITLSVSLEALATKNSNPFESWQEARTAATFDTRAKGTISTKGLSVENYPEAAKISSDQAGKTAVDAMPGSILSIGLRSRGGFLVYAVKIENMSGIREIAVDAGDGKILSRLN